MGKIDIINKSLDNLDEFTLLNDDEAMDTNGGLVCFFFNRVIIPDDGISLPECPYYT